MSESSHDPEVSPVVQRPPKYHSYLLRFWEERGEAAAHSIWRFSLEDPQTSERFGFANLDAMVDWIQVRILPLTSTDNNLAQSSTTDKEVI